MENLPNASMEGSMKSMKPRVFKVFKRAPISPQTSPLLGCKHIGLIWKNAEDDPETHIYSDCKVMKQVWQVNQ
ncbi:unnamed protein product [Toxocara canis]|uniref:Ovule protein n=1 Tax=Toxocara canis TaxID=6265 RepID=A0A183U261_TOXCA|nr:unnamed protein product [Toxocara canis]